MRSQPPGSQRGAHCQQHMGRHLCPAHAAAWGATRLGCREYLGPGLWRRDPCPAPHSLAPPGALEPALPARESSTPCCSPLYPFSGTARPDSPPSPWVPASGGVCSRQCLSGKSSPCCYPTLCSVLPQAGCSCHFLHLISWYMRLGQVAAGAGRAGACMHAGLGLLVRDGGVAPDPPPFLCSPGTQVGEALGPTSLLQSSSRAGSPQCCQGGHLQAGPRWLVMQGTRACGLCALWWLSWACGVGAEVPAGPMRLPGGGGSSLVVALWVSHVWQWTWAWLLCACAHG